MTRLVRAFLLAALAAFALPALANAAPATTRGIIVQRDAATGTVVVASSSGVLHRVAVASPASLQMGTLVRVRGSKIKVLGHARSAKVHGLVMRSSRHSYALAEQRRRRRGHDTDTPRRRTVGHGDGAGHSHRALR